MVSTRWFEKRFAELTGEAIHGVKGMIDLYQAGKYKTETEQVFRDFQVLRRDHGALYDPI